MFGVQKKEQVLFMKRILLMVLKLLGHVPVWFWRICSFAKDTEEQRYSIEEKYNYIREIAIKANKAGRVTIVSSGEENLPEEDGYILYPNHQGMFDVLAFLETMKRPFSLVFKQEVKDIILLKQIREALHYIPMDRSDMKQSMKVILEASNRVKAGENFLIFAEGNEEPEAMKPFLLRRAPLRRPQGRKHRLFRWHCLTVMHPLTEVPQSL